MKRSPDSSPPSPLRSLFELLGLGALLYAAGACRRFIPKSWLDKRREPLALPGARQLVLLPRRLAQLRPRRRTSIRAQLGNVLMVLGFALLFYSVGAYFGYLPGGYSSVSEPVALSQTGQRQARLESEAAPTTALPSAIPPTPMPAPTATAALAATPLPAATPAPIVLAAADAADRRDSAAAPKPGTPIRLKLPSIKVDAEVKPGGVITGRSGDPEWETLPFVATYYPQLGPVGAPGNPVISGHVVTLSEGNVFRDLYQVELGEPIEVLTEESHFSYRVEEIKLVSPDSVDVIAPTEDARLTIITCGGTFDPRTRSFSDRLIVIGKLVGGERL
jgi:LPXTG-site transpeptidase (sortase) family protein